VHVAVHDPRPSALGGDATDEVKRKAFLNAFTELSTRINYLLALPIEKLDRLTLRAKLDDIGRSTTNAGRRVNRGAVV
jgi:hypothetical protein